MAQAPAAKRKKSAKGSAAGGGSAVPAAQPATVRQTSTSGTAQSAEPTTAAAAPSKAATVRGASAPAVAAGNGAVAAKRGKTTKRKHSRPEAAAPGAAEPDGAAAAVQSSLEAAGVEVVPVAELRASAAAGANGAAPGEPPFRNREKVLMLTSRGIPPRHRHLMLDLGQLLPTAKRDAKLDTKSDRAVINEAAELKGCTSAMFFEARKRKDCYLWLSKVPAGPTAKFLIVNVHTMAELKLSGNHLKGSRPVLSFDKTFDEAPHWQLLKEVFSHVFATPKRHHRSKPFFDHVIAFCIADGRVWLRNYQVCQATEKPRAGGDATSLVEVGPRVCLNPILIFSGAFGGPVIWENPDYVSPNDLRAAEKKQAAGKYKGKVKKRAARREHVIKNRIPKDMLDDVFRD